MKIIELTAPDANFWRWGYDDEKFLLSDEDLKKIDLTIERLKIITKQHKITFNNKEYVYKKDFDFAYLTDGRILTLVKKSIFNFFGFNLFKNHHIDEIDLVLDCLNVNENTHFKILKSING